MGVDKNNKVVGLIDRIHELNNELSELYELSDTVPEVRAAVYRVGSPGQHRGNGSVEIYSAKKEQLQKAIQKINNELYTTRIDLDFALNDLYGYFRPSTIALIRDFYTGCLQDKELKEKYGCDYQRKLSRNLKAIV